MHRRSFASEGTLPKATRRARKRVRGNAEAWVSTLHKSCVGGTARRRVDVRRFAGRIVRRRRAQGQGRVHRRFDHVRLPPRASGSRRLPGAAAADAGRWLRGAQLRRAGAGRLSPFAVAHDEERQARLVAVAEGSAGLARARVGRRRLFLLPFGNKTPSSSYGRRPLATLLRKARASGARAIRRLFLLPFGNKTPSSSYGRRPLATLLRKARASGARAIRRLFYFCVARLPFRTDAFLFFTNRNQSLHFQHLFAKGKGYGFGSVSHTEPLENR